MFEFWLLLLLPWGLDLLGRRHVMASVFGAVLWGMGVVLGVSRLKTRDPRFRRFQSWLLGLLAATWLVYWGLSFLEVPPGGGGSLSQATTAGPWTLRVLVIAHASLLAAGVGAVFLLLLSSLLWLVQEKLLRRSSWERRGRAWRLPSLEALARVSLGALTFSFAAWGLGFLLAIVNGILKWHAANSFHWITDSRVLATALLWILLLLAFQGAQWISASRRTLHLVLFLLSLAFIVAFVFWFMLERHSALHLPVSWFVG